MTAKVFISYKTLKQLIRYCIYGVNATIVRGRVGNQRDAYSVVKDILLKYHFESLICVGYSHLCTLS